MRKASKNLEAYPEYLKLASRVKDHMGHGDYLLFIAKTGIRRQKIINALNGFYMRDGVRVIYKRPDILIKLVDFLEERRREEKEQLTRAAETLNEMSQ